MSLPADTVWITSAWPPNPKLTFSFTDWALVARSNYDAVKANGLTINSQNHGEHVVKPYNGELEQASIHKVAYTYNLVRTAAEAGSKFDYAVCAHKAIDQASAPAQIAAAVDENRTTIVIIQNGVGNEEPFRQAFPAATILSCVTWVGARQSKPGFIEHTQSEDMQMGSFPNKVNDPALEAKRLQDFADLLTVGETIFQVVPNIQVQRWEKVVWNAAWNPLTTLTLMTTHDWLNSSADATPMTRQLMKEVIDVARKCDVPIEYSLVDTLMDKILAMPPIGSSMQADYKNGKPMEVDIILGYPARKAKELNVPAPTLQTLYTVTTAVNLRVMREARLGS
ncbi:LOW QUALITY PROTEIN: Oxidoreductase AFT12-1 [Paramyrothecium foliicola]|nr:LOW QUALITY PROTEIN: Oxidoreductase AFT12-1 [Paramyrothecium foliicola]